MSIDLKQIHERLLPHFGPQGWWPAQSATEVLIGAVLTQNTSWKNVERAIVNLREADLLDLDALYRLGTEELAELIRPAGYFRLKAARLRNLVNFVVERYDGSLEAMRAANVSTLREELLSINGIGPETADSILLYALEMPSFVVDTYTLRIAARHGWVGFDTGYDELQDWFASHLVQDVALYNEFHALFVRVGHEHCRKQPKCEECPLRAMLPAGGPLEPFE